MNKQLHSREEIRKLLESMGFEFKGEINEKV